MSKQDNHVIYNSVFMICENLHVITNNTTKEEIRSCNQEYYDFMEKYHKEHACCPKCGSKHYSSTLAGYLFDAKHHEKYKDMNHVTCMDCDWKGVVHQLVPEKQQRVSLL